MFSFCKKTNLCLHLLLSGSGSGRGSFRALANIDRAIDVSSTQKCFFAVINQYQILHPNPSKCKILSLASKQSFYEFEYTVRP